MSLLHLLLFGTAAMVLHEMGHASAALLLKVKIHRAGINLRGMYIKRECGTAKRNLAITLAGAGVNLLLALLFYRTSHDFVLCNLAIGVVNLMPLRDSDGSRAMVLIRGLIRPQGLSVGTASTSELIGSEAK